MYKNESIIKEVKSRPTKEEKDQTLVIEFVSLVTIFANIEKNSNGN